MQLISSPGCTHRAPLQSIIDRALVRMQSWVHLASRTLNAEFPHWETFVAFGVFGLEKDCAERLDEGRAHCQTLGKAVGVQPTKLAAEIEAHRRAARRAYESGATFKQAWVNAIRAAQRSTRVQQGHPSYALRPVLLRYLAWGASTSGVEQGFGKQSQALGSAGVVRAADQLTDHQDSTNHLNV